MYKWFTIFTKQYHSTITKQSFYTLCLKKRADNNTVQSSFHNLYVLDYHYFVRLLIFGQGIAVLLSNFITCATSQKNVQSHVSKKTLKNVKNVTT